MAIYGSADNGILGGFTRNEMVVYVFISFVATNIVFIGVSGDIANRVVDGSVIMQLIKPIDYRISLIADAVGIMIYRFVIPSLFIWIGLEFYKVKVLGMPVVSLFELLAFLVSCIFSFFIYVLFDFIFGLVPFHTTYMFGLFILKDAFLAFLTGQMIPISFFPPLIQRFFEFMPFSSMVYVPVMIYLGKYTGMELVRAMLLQLVWIVLLYVLGDVLWRRITKKMVILGG